MLRGNRDWPLWQSRTVLCETAYSVLLIKKFWQHGFHERFRFGGRTPDVGRD